MTAISYAAESLDPSLGRVANIFFRIALTCAILPMAVGISIVLLYWIFDWEWLISAGVIMLPVGCFLVVLGLGFAITWAIREAAHARRQQRRTRWKTALGLILLLISNFGVAFLCMIAGIHLATRPNVNVLVINDTFAHIDNCTISVNSQKLHSGGIPASGSAYAKVRTDRYKDPRITLTQGGLNTELSKELHITTNDWGNSIHVNVKPGLKPELQTFEPRD